MTSSITLAIRSLPNSDDAEKSDHDDKSNFNLKTEDDLSGELLLPDDTAALRLID